MPDGGVPGRVSSEPDDWVPALGGQGPDDRRTGRVVNGRDG